MTDENKQPEAEDNSQQDSPNQDSQGDDSSQAAENQNVDVQGYGEPPDASGGS